MPRMDGIDFGKLMRLRPMPVVMVSSLTGKGSEITLRALELGRWILSPSRSSAFARDAGVQRDDRREDPHRVPGEACRA